MADTQPTTPTTGEDDVERVANRINLWLITQKRLALAESECHDLARAALAAISPTTEDAECPSCGGLNTSCPDGCGIDPKTGELNGTRLERPEDAEKRELAVTFVRELAEWEATTDSWYRHFKLFQEKAQSLLASIGERS